MDGLTLSLIVINILSQMGWLIFSLKYFVSFLENSLTLENFPHSLLLFKTRQSPYHFYPPPRIRCRLNFTDHRAQSTREVHYIEYIYKNVVNYKLRIDIHMDKFKQLEFTFIEAKINKWLCFVLPNQECYNNTAWPSNSICDIKKL